MPDYDLAGLAIICGEAERNARARPSVRGRRALHRSLRVLGLLTFAVIPLPIASAAIWGK